VNSVDLNTITKLVQTENADVNVSNRVNELPITHTLLRVSFSGVVPS